MRLKALERYGRTEKVERGLFSSALHAKNPWERRDINLWDWYGAYALRCIQACDRDLGLEGDLLGQRHLGGNE